MSGPRSGHLPVTNDVYNYEKIGRIGEGTFGVVYKAKDRRTGELVALKRLRLEHERDGMPVTSVRELRALQTCHHPHIVRLKGVATGSARSAVFLVFEFCQNDLGHIIDRLPAPLPLSEVKCLVLQLLSALGFMHGRWTMHRDIKPSNVLLDAEGRIKLCDFGLVRRWGALDDPTTPGVTTLWYRAPEVLLGGVDYTGKVDLWAVGCVFAELLRNAPLFPAKTEPALLAAHVALLGEPSERIWPGLSRLPGAASILKCATQPHNLLKQRFSELSPAGIDLLNGLLTFDPGRRLGASEALRHPFFSEHPLPKAQELMPTFPAMAFETASEPPSPRASRGKKAAGKRNTVRDAAGAF